MKSYSINAGVRTSRGKAQEAARRAIQRRGEDLMLVSWFDRSKNAGGPMEFCCDAPERAVADYARSHGAQFCVNVNDFSYEFYFMRIPSTVSEIKRSAVIASHRGLDKDRYDNIQGG